MPLDLFELLVGQRRGLQQQFHRQHNLADVVQRCRLLDQMGGLGGQIGQSREHAGESADPSNVLASTFVAHLADLAELVHEGVGGALEVVRPHPDLAFEIPIDLPLANHHVVKAQCVAHPQDHLGMVERLADEVVGPHLQRPQAGVFAGHAGDHDDWNLLMFAEFAAQQFEHFEAVEVGHVEIEHQQREIAVPGNRRQHPTRIGHHLDATHPLAAQQALQHRRVTRRVIADENLRFVQVRVDQHVWFGVGSNAASFLRRADGEL